MASNDFTQGFDEAAYRDQMIAAGLPAHDAAATAAKTAAAHRSAMNGNAYRLQLIAAGMAPEQAKVTAAAAAPFMGAVETEKGNAAAPKKKKEAPPKSMPPAIPAKPKAGPVTKREIKLIDAGAVIEGQPPSGEDMAFTHSILCQVGLPRSKVDGLHFLRHSGNAWVSVQAGLLDEGKGPVQQSVPYGPMPRLALAWVSTYAMRNKTREIPIGDSAADFLRLMGMGDTQGARYATLREQMHALAACRLQFGLKGRTFSSQPVEQFDAWQTNEIKKATRPLWPGVMLLSQTYFDSLMDSAVPLDNRALHALKGSALALDVYAWLAHRLHRIEGRPAILHWKSLRDQFAQEYQGKDPNKDFKDAFLPQLKNVLAVYPKAKVKQVTGGLMLMHSPPPIPKKA